MFWLDIEIPIRINSDVLLYKGLLISQSDFMNFDWKIDNKKTHIQKNVSLIYGGGGETRTLTPRGAGT